MRKKKSIKILPLVLFILIFLFVYNFEDIIGGTLFKSGFKTLQWDELKKIPIDLQKGLENSTLIFTDNSNIIVSANNQLKLYDKDGDIIVSKKINSHSSKVIGLKDYFAVIDLIQGDIVIMDFKANKFGEIMDLGNLKDVISIRNNIIVITGENRLQIFNEKGTLLSDVELPDGEILSLDLSKKENKIIITILSSDSENYNSKIITYSLDSNSMVGADNHYDSIIYSTNVYETSVMIVDSEGSHSYLITDTDNNIWNVKREGRLEHLTVDDNGNIFEIVYREKINNDKGQKYNYFLIGVNKDGGNIFEIGLDKKYDSISILKGRILLSNDKEAIIYSYGGKIISNYQDKRKMKSIKWLTYNRLLVEYNDYMKVFELVY